MKIISYTRRKCSIQDCDRPTRNKGFYKGKTRYGNICEIHHKRDGNNELIKRILNPISNKKCEICGWDKAYCDRHRIISKLGYTHKNVKVLCPNCHRLATIGLLKIFPN